MHHVADLSTGHGDTIFDARSETDTYSAGMTSGQTSASESAIITHVDDEDRVLWPNDNWRLVSKLVNSCQMSDGDATLLLDTMRSIDSRLSIPRSIRDLRKFEKTHLKGPFQ